MSCSDEPSAPSAPSQGGPATAQGQAVGHTALELIEEDYAAGLLDRENANRYRQYAVSRPAKLPVKYRSASRGKDATYSMVLMAREWSRLSKSTQDEILDIRRDGRGNLGDSVVTEHFILH